MKNIKKIQLFLWILAFLLMAGQTSAQCTNDTIPPICIAPADTTMTLAEWEAQGYSVTDSIQLEQVFGAPIVADNCPSPFFVALPVTETNICSLRQIIRRFQAVDQAGNVSAQARQVIALTSPYVPTHHIYIPADRRSTDTTTQLLKVDSVLQNGAVAHTFNEINFDYDCDDKIDRAIVEWTVLDWCLGGPSIELPRLDMDGDGVFGDAYEVTHIGDSLYVIDSLENPIQVLGPLSGVFTYRQINVFSDQEVLNTITVSGKLFNDGDDDCTLGSGENGLAGWRFEIVGQASGDVYPITTDDFGDYTAELCAYDTIFSVRMAIPMNYAGGCSSEYTHQFPTGADSLTANIPVNLETACPLLEVDLSLPFIRRCFSNIAYVNYCNYSADSILNPYVEVTLDSFMTVLSTSIPGTQIQGNQWSFDLDDLAPGECRTFTISYELDCEAELGQTHCAMAHIYPDSLCGESGNNWTGASIEVDAVCDGDSIRMSILNTGSGNMDAPLNYIVVEDVLMHSDGDFQLNSGDIMRFPLEANGSTWFLSAEQEPGHPGSNLPSVAIEGCGGNNDPGLATSFVQNDGNPFVSIECQPNQGSYDPNDKQVSPAGVGERHLVPANTQLEYLIRFQNTGTDTAFTVVIVDTLSTHLDAGSIVPGASSHPYTFQYAEDRVIRFTFDNIMLPDSNVNLEGSNGFVKFKIQQLEDNPDDTRIENSAAIYFDFNEPIITNTTFVTIGEDIFEVVTSVPKTYLPGVQASVFPNPASEQLRIEVEGVILQNGQFKIFNQLGRLIDQQPLNGNALDYNCGALTAGVYWYQIVNQEELLVSGKLMVF